MEYEEVVRLIAFAGAVAFAAGALLMLVHDILASGRERSKCRMWMDAVRKMQPLIQKTAVDITEECIDMMPEKLMRAKTYMNNTI